jgi:hypothetical protein
MRERLPNATVLLRSSAPFFDSCRSASDICRLSSQVPWFGTSAYPRGTSRGARISMPRGDIPNPIRTFLTTCEGH